MTKEEERTNYLIDKLSIKIKDFFINHKKIILTNPYENYDTESLKIYWNEELSIMVVADLFFEKHHYDNVIECCPAFYKIENIEDAWEEAETHINDYIEDYLLDQEHIDDYMEDPIENAIDDCFNDLVTWYDYESWYTKK